LPQKRHRAKRSSASPNDRASEKRSIEPREQPAGT
jgi:hypothetical protein